MSGSNVIVFMSDEHTCSVMGAYGNNLVHTPTLDRLANSGVRFDNAYTPSPICISARASFATGTQVFEHRCWSSAEPVPVVDPASSISAALSNTPHTTPRSHWP